MTGKLFVFFGLLFLNFRVSAQDPGGNIIYIVDSIRVVDDPEAGNEIDETDIAELTVIKNKDSLKQLDLEKFDGAIYIFTKEYRKRSEDIKRIPSTKQMVRQNGVFSFYDNIYSGKFIDYYYSGRKEGDGTFLSGILEGTRTVYYQNGKVAMERHYSNGIENGWGMEYYTDGSLKQKGEFLNGKEEGVWESYYPNGQVKLRSSYKHGEILDTATKYYSTGKVKEKVFIKNGKVTPDANLETIDKFMAKSGESNKEGDTKAAIKYCTKALEVDSTYAAAYFSRGTIKLNDFKFDDAITDFDKALIFEPFMEMALTNRAFARIRKYQFANSRTLSQNSEVTVLASKDKVPVPPEEQEKICNDLQKAVFLGAKSKMISEALSDYCEAKGDAEK